MTQKKFPKHGNPTTAFKTDRDTGLVRWNGAQWLDVAPYIRVTGLANEEGDGRYLVRLKFKTLDDRISTLFLPRQDLDAPRVLIGTLLDSGFQVPTQKGAKDALLTYLRETLPKRRFLIVNRSGWCDHTYILANGDLIGPASKLKIEYRPLECRQGQLVPDVLGGSLEGWQAGVAEPARYSRRMMFGIATSFASMLLKITNIESGLFHIFGPSSKGKTISMLAAQSVFMRAQKTSLISWDITPNAMEEIAADYCDRVLILDEAGLLFGTDPRRGLQVARDIAFKLTAGSGRRRSRFFTKGAKTTDWSWRLIVLSSGEHSFGEMEAKAGLDRLSGEKVRVIDVPAIMNEELGIFHAVPPGKTSADLAAQVEAASQRHFGHPARVFAQFLTDSLSKDRKAVLDRINDLVAVFHDVAQVPRDSWELRFASRFALSYAALCLAIRAKVIPWSKGEALEAIIDTYHAARSSLHKYDGTLESSWARVCKKLRRCNGLIDLTTAQARKAAQYGSARGYIKQDAKHGRYFIIPPKTMLRWAGEGVSLVSLGAWMLHKGYLITTNRSLPTRQVKIPGIKERHTYYCIRAKAIEEE